MPKPPAPPDPHRHVAQRGVVELKASANLMTLDAGMFCVFHAPGSAGPDANGLPGVRVTRAPVRLASEGAVEIRSLRDDGWLDSGGGAALVRVDGAPARILVTVYQSGDGRAEAPKLQVLRLSGEAAAPAAAPALSAPALTAPAPGASVAAAAPVVPNAEVAAHVARRGDLMVRLGDWVGERGSRDWIEGFAIGPRPPVGLDGIEYQAVLGRGWLSPWAEGGAFCGSRGMGLPLLGLRVRLRGDAARTHECAVFATFVDGTAVGPLPAGEACESPSLAPLEAFRVVVTPRSADAGAPAGETPAAPEAKGQAAPARAAKDRPAAEPDAGAGRKNKGGKAKGGKPKAGKPKADKRRH